MKKQYLSVSLFLALALALPVFAEEGNINAGRRASTTERREDRMENREERKASSTERRVEMQRGLAKRKAEHTARVLTATVERLERIIVRLESRIAKVRGNGGAVAETEAFVAEAKNHLSLAKSSIALFVSLDLTGQKAQENFERVRTLAAEVKGHIREAHTSLMKAIRSLKPGQRTATSTSDSEEE
ncbi:MAG: hypothetical protein AAB782_00090 [Patescibacteria group bacterium]